MRLIHNLTGTHDHLAELQSCISAASESWIFVAYLRTSAVNHLAHAIRSAGRRTTPINIYCGLDQYFTDPDALRVLSNALKSNPNGILYLVEPTNRTRFHPKLYCFFRGTKLRIVVGSANLTDGGLRKNIEASLSMVFPRSSPVARQVNDFRRAVARHANEATELRIRQYERKFRILDAARRRADKEAAKQIRQHRDLSPKEIEKWVHRYRRAKNGEPEFADRQNNYREAKKVLDQICETRIRSKAEFLTLYTRLVGRRGQGHLFWSTGLFRGKNLVARNWPVVMAMIRKIRASRRLSDEDTFELAKGYADRVKGLGVNFFTEVMNTYAPRRFSVLNGNPLTSLVEFGCDPFKSPNAFTARDYASYNAILRDLRDSHKFASFSQVDHFLNFVYQILKRQTRSLRRDLSGKLPRTIAD